MPELDERDTTKCLYKSADTKCGEAKAYAGQTHLRAQMTDAIALPQPH